MEYNFQGSSNEKKILNRFYESTEYDEIHIEIYVPHRLNIKYMYAMLLELTLRGYDIVEAFNSIYSHTRRIRTHSYKYVYYSFIYGNRNYLLWHEKTENYCIAARKYG